MSKKLVKKLVDYSYKDNKLSVENVESVAQLLDRSGLNLYIKALKGRERKLSVIIDVPINNISVKGKFKEIFPNKKIVWNIDPSLMLGARIIDDDMLFEMNLKNTLDKILSYMEQNYD